MFQQQTRSGPTGAAEYDPVSNNSVEWRIEGRSSPMSLLSEHDLYLFNEGSHIPPIRPAGFAHAHPRSASQVQILLCGRPTPNAFT